MKKIVKEAKGLLKAIGEELVTIDRHTDVSRFLIQHVMLNDDYEEEMENDNSHFGIVSVASSLIFLGVAWAVASSLLILL